MQARIILAITWWEEGNGNSVSASGGVLNRTPSSRSLSEVGATVRLPNGHSSKANVDNYLFVQWIFKSSDAEIPGSFTEMGWAHSRYAKRCPTTYCEHILGWIQRDSEYHNPHWLHWDKQVLSISRDLVLVEERHVLICYISLTRANESETSPLTLGLGSGDIHKYMYGYVIISKGIISIQKLRLPPI